MSTPLLSSQESQLTSFSRNFLDPENESTWEEASQEGGEEDEKVAVARPPRSAAAPAEVVLSGQAAMDTLDQVT